MEKTETALLRLGTRLDDLGYDFVTPTPATHARVVSRSPAGQGAAPDLRAIFGWSLPFEETHLPPALLEALRASGFVERTQRGMLKSRVRFSRLDGRLHVHSAHPTVERDCVFFGPDTYRFVRFLRDCGPFRGRIADIGAGSGAGGLSLLAGTDRPERVVLADVNPLALGFARVNARLGGHELERVELLESRGLAGVPGALDAVIANPPFIMDEGKRSYRDGGGLHGARLSLDWAREALARLGRGGKLAMYTGSAIVAGRDRFKEELAKLARGEGARLDYAEIDPDIFGEELEKEAYSDVERIAAVGLVASRA